MLARGLTDALSASLLNQRLTAARHGVVDLSGNALGYPARISRHAFPRASIASSQVPDADSVASALTVVAYLDSLRVVGSLCELSRRETSRRFSNRLLALLPSRWSMVLRSHTPFM